MQKVGIKENVSGGMRKFKLVVKEKRNGDAVHAGHPPSYIIPLKSLVTYFFKFLILLFFTYLTN